VFFRWLPLGLGIGMLARPSQRWYEMLRPVTIAMVFASLWICGTGWTNILVGLSATRPWTIQIAPRVCAGLAEMLVPAVAATAVLTIAWSLAAIGLRRLY
jgi:hypothetical protein